MLRIRAALIAIACLLLVILPPAADAQSGDSQASLPAGTELAAAAVAQPGGTIAAIKIEGNQRIEDGTILSYMLVAPGDPFDQARLDRSLKTLYATGLFKDVTLLRQGNTLVVKVAENPIVDRVAYEGNHLLTNKILDGIVQLRSRAVYTAAATEADRKRILDAYARRGHYSATVVPKTIPRSDNRVDVVFAINEGQAAFISRVAFVGNRHFGESQLKDVISSRQHYWYMFFSTADEYQPERLKFDEELLKRFYYKNGYIDFRVVSANAELAPDRKSFFVTYTLHEGARYRLSKVSVVSHLRHLTDQQLLPMVGLHTGEWYDGDAVERAVKKISTAVQNMGHAFVVVNPRIVRHRKTHTVDLAFNVDQGPRVFVQQIHITGNTRTEDSVVRRQFQLAEGDAFNAERIRQSRQNLQDLGYFKSVDITTSPGTSPDRVVLNTKVQEEATGELTLGGGYSTDIGLLANVGLREKNLLGTGIDAGISGVLAQKASQIDLSVTNPYLFGRNLLGGIDVFRTVNDNQSISQYDEARTGFTLRLGYDFNQHLRQTLAYSLIQRDVYNVQPTASLYVKDEAGNSLLSQIGQTLTLDYRDSRINPHRGFVLRFGTDFAGIGGDARFVRTRLDGSYYIPLDAFTGNSKWGISLSAGTGYLFTLGRQEKIIDNFFLGGASLRGFQDGGVGPHDVATGDSLGGRFFYTQSTELHFPLPLPKDLGISGRAFVDIGSLSDVSSQFGPVYSNPSPRVGVGVGISWNTPFGLINIDVADPIVKYKDDQTQVFRFGFGTRF